MPLTQRRLARAPTRHFYKTGDILKEQENISEWRISAFKNMKCVFTGAGWEFSLC